MITISELAKKLFAEKSVALFVHINPDGDALGSALALKCALNNSGVKADVYSNDEVPKKFAFFNQAKFVKTKLDSEYSAFVAIDNAEISRLGKFSEDFAKHKNTYSIDHHISNTLYAKFNYVLDMASNSENILELLTVQGVEITEEIANLLLTGIITDTGNFRHKNTTEKTLLSASKLLEKGGDINKITYETFTKQSKQRAKLFSLVMGKIRYFMDDKIGVITVNLSDFDLTGAKQEETEGFIDFVMGIDTVEIGLCVMEVEKGKYKVSFRSKGADVNMVASAFGGGGHKLASGCRIAGDYEEVIERLVFETSKYIDE